LLKACMMVLACVYLLLGTGWAAEEMRTVVDGRGEEVQVPMEIERVVAVSNGFIESVMFVLGEEDKLVGGRDCVQSIYNYSYPTVEGETYEYKDGMMPVTYMKPVWDFTVIATTQTAINYEALTALDPDVAIIRVTTTSMDDEMVQKTISMIEALGIPVVVLKSHTCFDKPDLSTISDEIRIIGNIFGKEEKAAELADYLESQTQMVFERTKDIPDSEKTTVLIFGASPKAREAGGTGLVMGTNTIDSYFVEDIVHAKNAFGEPGQPDISAEHLLALDPDVIVLTTWWGYHPPEELYTAPYYQNVAELSALRKHRVYALPWTPNYTGKRIEYPIDLMVIAKAAYPERFEDIKVHEWVLEFYQNVYGVDEETAIGLRSAQWLDWTVEEDF